MKKLIRIAKDQWKKFVASLEEQEQTTSGVQLKFDKALDERILSELRILQPKIAYLQNVQKEDNPFSPMIQKMISLFDSAIHYTARYQYDDVISCIRNIKIDLYAYGKLQELVTLVESGQEIPAGMSIVQIPYLFDRVYFCLHFCDQML